MFEPDRLNSVKRHWRSVRQNVWSAWVSLYESPWAELLTAVGTVVGSAIISVSGGLADRWWLILVGGVIIVLGLLPTWSKSTALSRGLQDDAYQDARAEIARDYALTTLTHATEVEDLDRAARVEVAAQKVQTVVEDIWAKFYDGSPTVRVVYYAVSADRQRLTLQGRPAGRPDEPREFDATVDRRGEIAIERLDMEAAYELHRVEALPDEWGAGGRSYVDFISLPVRVGRRGYGLISVDSALPGELLERDGESLGAYAAALEFYLAAAERGRHGRRKDGEGDG